MRSTLATLLLLSLLLSAAVLVGCNQSVPNDSAETADASAQTVNEVCPIMGGKVTAEGGTVEWNGKTIGFCCDGCEEKWEALTDHEKTEKLAAAQTKVNEDAPHGDHDPS